MGGHVQIKKITEKNISCTKKKTGNSKNTTISTVLYHRKGEENEKTHANNYTHAYKLRDRASSTTTANVVAAVATATNNNEITQ